MDHHSVERGVLKILPKKILANFRQKKADISEWFWSKFYIPHCPLRSLTLTIIFSEGIGRIRLLIT